MRYYENSLGIFISEVVPDGSAELTKAEFAARLDEIRRTAARRAAEAAEEAEAAEAAETAEAEEKEAATDEN